jgi:hypothetical protein
MSTTIGGAGGPDPRVRGGAGAAQWKLSPQAQLPAALGLSIVNPCSEMVSLKSIVAVQPGGCSGLIYQLYFDERFLDGDQTVDFDGVEVIVDAGRPGSPAAAGS